MKQFKCWKAKGMNQVRKTQMTVIDHDSTDIHPPFDMDISRYSRLLKVLRVLRAMAWCNRFINSCRKRENVQDDPSVHSYIANSGIEGKVIPQRVAWQGIFYEHLMQNLKNCLSLAVGQICFSGDQLRSLMAETSSIVNSRPSCYIGSGRND